MPTTGHIKAFSVTKNSAAYFKGSKDEAALQRVYGISFPDKKMLKEHQVRGVWDERLKTDIPTSMLRESAERTSGGRISK